MAISLLAYVVTFQERVFFGEATSSHFFKVTTSTPVSFPEQLFLHSSYFFEELLF